MNNSEVYAAFSSLKLGDVAKITELVGGSSRAYKIERVEDASVVFKIYPDFLPDTAAREMYVTNLLHDLPVPITRHLVADNSRTKLPYRYAVTNFIDGQPAGALASHPDVASLYRQIGTLLRTLHQVQMRGYGALDAHGVVDPVFTHTELMRGHIDFHLQQFLAMGADKTLAATLRTILDAQFDGVVPHSKGSVFAHDDLHPNNVLAIESQDGRLVLSGLIDFGNARAADPVYDLAKCLFCSEDNAPGSASHILDGYGTIDHPKPQTAIDFYTLLHRITMWWWLRKVGYIAEPETPSELMNALRSTASV